jgi:hypothetical protein
LLFRGFRDYSFTALTVGYCLPTLPQPTVAP